MGNELNWFCRLESFSVNLITCRMPTYHPDWNTSNVQGVIVSSRLTEDSVCEGSCTFTYGDQGTSPFLTAISSVSQAGTVTLTGENFDVIGFPDIRVAIENSLTKEITQVVPDSATATSVVFTVPAVQAARYLARVRLDPIGETNSLAFEIRSKFSSSSLSGSTQGGYISLTGENLPSEWPSMLFNLEVSTGGAKVDPVVVSATPQKM